MPSKYAWRLLTRVDFGEKEKGLEAVVRAALVEAAQIYIRNRPRHFDQGARSRYGYQPRTAGTMKSKRIVVGRGFIMRRMYISTRTGEAVASRGTIMRLWSAKRKAWTLYEKIFIDYRTMYDLNWTGRSREEFTGNAPRVETARVTVKVHIKVPPYINARRGMGSNKRAELTTLSDDERAAMRQIVQTRVSTYLRQRHALRELESAYRARELTAGHMSAGWRMAGG